MKFLGGGNNSSREHGCLGPSHGEIVFFTTWNASIHQYIILYLGWGSLPPRCGVKPGVVYFHSIFTSSTKVWWSIDCLIVWWDHRPDIPISPLDSLDQDRESILPRSYALCSEPPLVRPVRVRGHGLRDGQTGHPITGHVFDPFSVSKDEDLTI